MDPSDQVTDLETRVNQLEDRADRRTVWLNVLLFVLNFLLVCYMFGILAVRVPVFKKMFQEMLGDEPMPIITRLFVSGRLYVVGFLLCSVIGLTIFNVVTKFSHRHGIALNASLLAVHASALLLLWQALMAPFLTLIEQLGA